MRLIGSRKAVLSIFKRNVRCDLSLELYFTANFFLMISVSSSTCLVFIVSVNNYYGLINRRIKLR